MEVRMIWSPWRDVLDVELPLGVGGVDHRGVRADALAPHVIVVGQGGGEEQGEQEEEGEGHGGAGGGATT